MIRPNWIWVALSMVTFTAGCRMCATCDDYSGPVVGVGGCETSCSTRVGSILSGPPPMAQPMPEMMQEPVPEQEPQPQLGPNVQTQTAPHLGPSNSQYRDVASQLGIDPKMIISVTDRKVEDTESAAPSEAPQVAEESAQPTSGQPQIRSVKTDPAAR